MADFRRRSFRAPNLGLMLGVSLMALSACMDRVDLDLRGPRGGDTSEAALTATQRRPIPDNRGVISYPNFQVAISRRGDTVADVANRVGVDANELARYNGIDSFAKLRDGEVIALPGRVAEPSPETGAIGVGPIRPVEEIDITTLAGDALDRSADASARSPFQTKEAPPLTGTEPVRHKVARGETAYSISRLYRISVRSLADWNGLGPDLTVREGQYLLIPLAKDERPARESETDTSSPGQGTLTPEPPSASKALPQEEAAPVKITPAPPKPNLGEERSTTDSAKLLRPVNGKIIRGYEKGKTDGIDISASSGTAVKAAADGTVAAITRNTDQVPIMVLRHADNLLTVYANIDNVTLLKGAKVSRGQTIATVRGTDPSFLHFEVRKGFDSVDPVPFLN